MSRTIQADLATITDASGITPRSAVAIPPDAAEAAAGLIRVVLAGGLVITRAYDPGIDQ